MSERRQPALELLRTEILPAYAIDPERTVIEELRAGHINDSFRVRSTAAGNTAPGRADLIVQRINSHVFAKPRDLMANFVVVTEHVRRRLIAEGVAEVDRQCLELRETASGNPFTEDSEGELWRATHFVAGTLTRPLASDARLAREAGRAYGRFQSLLSDLDASSVIETIPHFHDTPKRFQALDRAIAADSAGRLAGVSATVAATIEQRPLASHLLDLAAERGLPVRVAHNDAKLTNVLLDVSTERAVAVVDLDTVMPGLSLFDFGDMARSMSHRTAEDEKDPTRICVDPELFGALAEGYLETALHLSDTEREHLVDAAQVLVLEQAVRYLTDDLEGDQYFRVTRDRQNLDRAKAHLALLASLRSQESDLRARVQKVIRKTARARSESSPSP